MQVINSPFYADCLHTIKKPFGEFFIFPDFVIGEISEGVHYNWDLAIEVIEEVYEYFGSRDIDVTYISNRIHSYSLHPQDWIKFFKNNHYINGFGIVTYNKITFKNVLIEKLFFTSNLRQFETLEAAIDWALSLSSRNKRRKKG
ncbi:MAG: hypothetical protein CMC35_02325 [Flavobacteriaceae bacterium]|nr:hypothetical protein [Flavobacteriaceae bacterium]|tara:strand:- start:44148 stop:44579 length:432 start_codon:yes stop_codon:yes gene_type:complete